MFDDEADDQELPPAGPVLAWPGGKRRLTQYIVPLIPEHTAYCEVFFGGGAVFFAKPPSAVEVINDINGDLVKFYRCCKYHLDTLLDETDFVLNARQEITDYREQRGLTDIQRAARFFLINLLSFGGTGTGFRVQRTHAMPSRMQRLVAIRALARRLDRTAVENLPWEKCVQIYDAVETFFFFDPPYLDSGGAAYAGWSEHELARFCARLMELKGKWVFTFQDCAQVRDLMPGFEPVEITRANGIGNKNGKTGRVYQEVIFTSERRPPTARRKGRSA